MSNYQLAGQKFDQFQRELQREFSDEEGRIQLGRLTDEYKTRFGREALSYLDSIESELDLSIRLKEDYKLRNEKIPPSLRKKISKLTSKRESLMDLLKDVQ